MMCLCCGHVWDDGKYPWLNGDAPESKEPCDCEEFCMGACMAAFCEGPKCLKHCLCVPEEKERQRRVKKEVDELLEGLDAYLMLSSSIFPSQHSTIKHWVGQYLKSKFYRNKN